MRYLGCDKVGGVTRRHEQAVFCSQLFGETKVADPDGLCVPALVHVEDVAGLQVSVHHLQTPHNQVQSGGHEHPQVHNISSHVLVLPGLHPQVRRVYRLTEEPKERDKADVPPAHAGTPPSW